MPAKKKTTDPETPRFESTINELETLIRRMENSDISLEDSLLAFEQGVKLTREAQAALASAEQRVKLLTEKNGEIVGTTFDLEDNDQ